MNVDLIYAGQEETGPVPFGIALIGAVLEKENHQVRVLDFDGDSIDEKKWKKVQIEKLSHNEAAFRN